MITGTEFIATVEGFGIDAVGVCRPDGLSVFVEGALPGEVIRARVFEHKKRYAKAKLIEIVQKSPYRAVPPCGIYMECGGCCAQHMLYGLSLDMKRKQVIDALSHIANFNKSELTDIIRPTIGMDQPYHYRNKAEFAVTDSIPLIGYRKKNSHKVIDIPECLLLHPSALQIKGAIKSWLALFDKVEVSSIVARVNKSGECMAVINGSLNSRCAAEAALLLQERVDKLTGVTVNDSGEKRLLFGKPYLSESLVGIEFTISPDAFFQINYSQAEMLFKAAAEYASLTGSETVVDAYCGSGVLSLFMAKNAGRVIGIEMNKSSINDAMENAKLNGIANAEFIAGTVEIELPKLIKHRPDVVMLDPPRKGCAREVLFAVLEASPERIVYISCNPSTLARDLGILSRGYELVSGVPVDMFCWTGHVECVVLLTKKAAERPIK